MEQIHSLSELYKFIDDSSPPLSSVPVKKDSYAVSFLFSRPPSHTMRQSRSQDLNGTSVRSESTKSDSGGSNNTSNIFNGSSGKKRTLLLVFAPFDVESLRLKEDLEDALKMCSTEPSTFRCVCADESAHDILELMHVTRLPSVAFFSDKSLQWTEDNPTMALLKERLPELLDSGANSSRVMSPHRSLRRVATVSSIGGDVARPEQIDITTSRYRVHGMCCEMEAVMVYNLLSGKEGVMSVHSDVVGRRVHVVHDSSIISAPAIQQLLNDLHLSAQLQETNDQVALPMRPRWVQWSRVIAMLFLVVYATPLNDNGCFAACYALGAIDLLLPFLKMFKKLELRATYCLVLAGFVAALVLKDNLSAAVVCLITSWCSALSDEAARRVNNELLFLFTCTVPNTVTTTSGDKRPLALITPNEVITVCAGEQIPLDGMVLSGNAAVDESMIDGSVIPVTKREMSRVVSGSVVQCGRLEIRVTTYPEECTVALTTQDCSWYREARAHHQSLVDTLTRYYLVLLVIAVLAVGLIVPIHMKQEPGLWITRALQGIVLCAPPSLLFVFRLPLSIACIVVAQRGILVKHPSTMERLHKVTHLACDKTGTVTDGLFQVIDVARNDSYDDNTLLLAASLENKSTHPTAVAVVHYFTGCIASNIAVYGASGCTLLPVSDYEMIPHVGVRGVVDGRTVVVGNGLTVKNKTLPPGFMDLYRQYPTCTHVYVLIDDVVRLGFVLHDKVRTSAPNMFGLAHRYHLGSSLITGDRVDVVQRVQRVCAARLSHGGMKADDKVRHVKALQRQREVVAMVGDAMNDATAIASADVGFVLATSGSAMATQSADVALVSDDLTRIPLLISFSRTVREVCRGNLFLAVVIKIAFVVAYANNRVSFTTAALSDLIAVFLVLVTSSSLALSWPDIAQEVEVLFSTGAAVMPGNSFSHHGPSCPTRETYVLADDLPLLSVTQASRADYGAADEKHFGI